MPEVSFGPRLTVRSKSDECSAPWFFCLGNVHGNGAVGWPAEEVLLQYVLSGYKPRLHVGPADLRVLVCTSPEDWQAQPYRWASPARLARVEASAMQHGLLALAKQAPVSLLEAAAQQAFWDANTATLLDLCKLLELAPEAQTLFAALLALLQARLPAATEVEIAELLSRRLASGAGLAPELFHDEGIAELFDNVDRRAVDAMLEEEAKAAESSSD